MIKKKQDKNNSGNAYREYIEFINQLNISQPLSVLFLLLPNIVILADLLLEVQPQSNFVKDLSYLGVSNMLFEVGKESNQLGLMINISIIVMLLAPLYSILTILVWSHFQNSNFNGLYKQKYQKSLINTTIRIYFTSFPYIFLPIFISYGTKILLIDSTHQIEGIVIIILTILNTILIEYHIFQLGNSDIENKNLVSLNYPYHMIDDGMVILGLVILNISSGLVSQIAGSSTTLLRLSLTLYIPFFNGFYQKLYKFIAIAAFVASFSLLITQFNIGQYYILMLAAILIFILFRTKIQHPPPVWQQLQAIEQDQQGLKAIKKRLYGKGMFVRSFRELIFLGRKNNSHRNQLQIQILKSKCSQLQKLNRGGARVCSARDVIKFEQDIIKFVANFLKACQLSVSILKFAQNKEGRKQVLAKAVCNLVNLLGENKEVIKQLFQSNEYSTESRLLLLRTYNSLYNDSSFMREAEKWTQEHIQLGNQKEIKQRIFNDKTAVMFINILQQVGKVVKISKNLPNVLGYQSNNLMGLSINEIIPFSVKPYHDSNLLQFVQGYSNKLSKNDNHIKFYAYNKDFHLQEVSIRYNWILSDFNTFLMAGIVQKIQSQNHVILTDQYGNLQGWTKGIGSQEFNLDELTISQRKKYNIMPLFPTLIKYMDSLGVTLRTLFFKNSKARDPKFVVISSQDNIPLAEVQARLLTSFKRILKDELIVGVCFAEIEFSKLSLCRGRSQMWKLEIKQFQRIQNIFQVCAMIQRLNTNSNTNNNQMKTEKQLASLQSMGQPSQKQQISNFSEDNLIIKRLDSNFSLNTQGINSIAYEQLVFGQINNSKTSFQIGNLYLNHLKKQGDKEDRIVNNPSAEVSFNPTLQKNSSLFWYVLLVSIVFLLLYIMNVIAVVNSGNQFNQQCKNVVQRNKATSIYLKSIFNPNTTYINRFANGSLLQNMVYLYSQYFNYTTFLGDIIPQNKYYMFNTQIPSTLQRLTSSPIIYSNKTVNIIPPTNYDYYTQMTSNYLNVIYEFDIKFTKTLQVWSDKISGIRNDFFIKLIFLCLCSAGYAFLLILKRIRETAHKQTLQALFKFQKQDLQKKISQIGILVRQMQSQAAQMNLLKQFGQIVKRQQIQNVQFNLIKNQYEVKIKFEHQQQIQDNIQKKKYYISLIVLVAFLIAQITFLILHSVTSLNTLDFYQNTPSDLDNAAKLIVYPNFLLADLYLPLQNNLRTKYDTLVNQALAAPINSIPMLYNFLGNIPCSNCTFMYPVLSTNYKSFYSTFLQRVTDIKSSNSVSNNVIQDLFYGADYVIQRITPVLLTISYQYVQFSIIMYLISMSILCIYMYLGTTSTNTEIQKLQMFLKYFSEQTITKNKHLNRLFSNIT